MPRPWRSCPAPAFSLCLGPLAPFVWPLFPCMVLMSHGPRSPSYVRVSQTEGDGVQRFPPRLATSVRQVTRDQMEPGPTGSDTGRSWFLLSSGCDGSRYYRVAHGTGPIPNEIQFPCRTRVACLVPPLCMHPTLLNNVHRRDWGGRWPHTHTRALTTEPPCGWGGRDQKKFTAGWIRKVFADTTRRTENQKRWAQTAACGASSCAHPRSRAILRNAHLSGGPSSLETRLAASALLGHCETERSPTWGVHWTQLDPTEFPV